MPAPEEALSAGNITFTGYEGAEINAYQALPAGAGPFPGVLVIHHLPGWDSTTKEITRRFAAEGYNALCPNLYARQGLHVDPDDAAAATREAGGIPDDQFVGDAEAAVERAAGAAHLQRQGRRHRLLLGRTALVPHCGERARRCGCRLLRGLCRGHSSRRLPAQGDAAGGPDAATSACPLLGLFGNDDQFPNPEQVDELEAALKAAGKTYEFHRYDGAGHAFFSVDRPAYRPEAAVDGWQRIFEWYGRYLAGG